MPHVIGLYSPAAQSGKSTISDHLVREHGYEIVKFAGPLKDMARGLLHGMGLQGEMVERMVEGDLKEAPIPGFELVTPRRIMQTLGTDWGREAIDLDLWTKTAVSRIEALVSAGRNVVVDDLRFPNEFAALRRLVGSHMVRVVRPGVKIVGGAYEALLEDQFFDRQITNGGTILTLQGRIDLMHRDGWR
jgi:hypothetical protein